MKERGGRGGRGGRHRETEEEKGGGEAGGGGAGRWRQETGKRRQMIRNSNSKTLFYKDCSLGSDKNLTTSPC